MLNPIVLTPDPTNTFYQLAAADYQTLQQALIFTNNPDGTQIQVTLVGVVYNPQQVVAQAQAAEVAAQTEITEAQSIEVSQQGAQLK